LREEGRRNVEETKFRSPRILVSVLAWRDEKALANGARRPSSNLGGGLQKSSKSYRVTRFIDDLGSS